MSESGISKHDQVLAGLVFSLQAAAMQQLGKIQSPLTGKIERDLDQARGTIDILEMLKVKCRQDTPEEIVRLVDTAVMELQMNYLDEVKKEQAEAAAGPAENDTAAESNAADSDAAAAGDAGAESADGASQEPDTGSSGSADEQKD